MLKDKKTKEEQPQNTARGQLILNQLDQILNSNYSTRLEHSANGDLLDTISEKLNALCDQLESKTSNGTDKRRLENMMEVLLEYSVSNFSTKVPLSGNGDEVDAVAAGLNAMGEEMEYLFEIQKKYAADLETSNKKFIESTEKIQAIFDNAPDAIIATDLETHITEWNRAAEGIYGFKRSEVIGKKASEIIISSYAKPSTREELRAKIMNEGSWSGEIIQHTSRKGKMTVLCSTSLIKDHNQKPIGYLGVNRDLTPLKKTREALITSESKYQLLVNEIVDYAIIMLNKEGIIESWNKGAEKINGYKDHEIIGKHFSKFYTDAEKREGLPELALSEASQQGKFSNSGWRKKKDGTLFWADVIITKLVDEKGEAKGFVKITRDLSEKRRVEEEIIQKSEELKRSNTELEQFAYVASHDLQEPLRMITSYVQLLSKHYKGKLDQDADDFINFAVDGASRMQTLIYSLLEYSRINRIKPFENIDLDETLHEVIKDLELTVKETKTQITWDKLPVIYGDKILIGQLFLNLIANAIKFRSDDPPKIKITCKQKNGFFQFTVSDNGIGIKQDYCEKIFVIFQRLHSKDKYPGTGIGLAICKKIVERHGGTIWVESELNKGSQFKFTIKIR